METREDLLARIDQLERRLARLEDIEAIERLQRMYGYYIDNRLWDEMAALFADEGAAIEIGRRGRYVGREAIRAFLVEVLGQGRSGLSKDEFINHLQLQGVVTVADDGRHAQGRWRALVQGHSPPGGGRMLWAEGVYENTYVKEHGQWRIARLWWVPTFYVQHPIDGAIAFASGPASEAVPPHEPSQPPDAALGRTFAPFHYPHPVTGATVTRIASPPPSTTAGETP